MAQSRSKARKQAAPRRRPRPKSQPGPVSDSSIYVHAGRVLARRGPEQRVRIFDLLKGQILELDQIAAELFWAIDGKRTFKNLTDEFTRRYDLPSTSFNREATKLIRQLLDKGILQENGNHLQVR